MDASTVPALIARAAANPDKPIRTGRNREYPRQLWWFLASCIAFIGLCQFASWIARKYSSSRRCSQMDSEAGAPPSTRRFSWRRLPWAAVNAFRVIAFRWTANIGKYCTFTFAEVFIVCGYTIALYTWAFVNTTDLAGHKLDTSYWENRAGVLGASQLPLIVALGTKNNALSYITGVSHERLKFIHRMIARVVFVLLWAHGIARANADGVVQHSLMNAQYLPWFVPLGIVAMLAWTVLLVVSIKPIRARAYELFYYVHFVSVLIILLAGYFHADNQKFGFYVWPCFIIWGLDRAIRLGRLIYYNHLYFGLSEVSHRLDASVELLSPQLVRLHLKRPPHFRWTPGQTAYLAMPSVSKFPIESHPFTIASVDARYDLGDAKRPRLADVEKNGSDAEADPTLYWNELVFLIQVREGYTRRLADAAVEGEKVKVLVDGPYGFSPDLDNDDTVVLIAGSSGVSYTLSAFLGVLSHIQKGKSKCQKVIFVWCIREASHIEWVSNALTRALELAPSDVEIVIRIFVTGGSAPTLQKEGSWSEDESVHSSQGADGKAKPSSLLNFPAVQVAEGRPDLSALIKEEVEANTGRLSVTVCGSQGIARTCREALRLPATTALKGGPSVVLHVESFGYA
ncbi:iron reductase [Pilatotrama ljubarskyi]|nr:iron reductase [Pilatotrama ljubarskyi]